MLNREEKIYPNGLKHVHYHVPFLKSVAIGYYVKTGSSNEYTPEYEGIAHFLEHMVFNGAEKHQDGVKAQRELANNSIYENAWTWLSMTNYYLYVPRESLDIANDILFDRVFHPLLRDENVEKERGIIQEERIMSENKPENVLDDRVSEKLYEGSSYAHPTIGTEKSIGNLTSQMLKDFHQTYYSAENVVYVTYGGVTMEEVAKSAAPYLESLHKAEIPKHDPKLKLVANSGNPLEIEKEVSSAFYQCLLYLSPIRSLDQYVTYLIMSGYLAGGEASLFEQELRVKNSLVSSYAANIQNFRDISQLYFSSSMNDANRQTVRELFHRKLTSITSEMEDADFERAKGYVYGGLVRSLEDLAAMVHVNAGSVERIRFLTGTDIQLKQLADRLKSIQKKDILDIWGQEDLSIFRDGFVVPTAKEKD